MVRRSYSAEQNRPYSIINSFQFIDSPLILQAKVALWHGCGSTALSLGTMRKWFSGRMLPCQGRGREFESRLPLHEDKTSLEAVQM